MLLSGWIALVPSALPNLIWALLPGRSAAAPPLPPSSPVRKGLAVVEGAGRIAVMARPLFLELRVQTGLDRVLAALAALALLVYYAGWARYFLRGRAPALLGAPPGWLPVPLAVSPVVYFLVFAGLARSLLMALVAGGLRGRARLPVS